MKVNKQLKKTLQTRRIVMISGVIGLLFIAFFFINPLQLSQFDFTEDVDYADYTANIITPADQTLTNIMDSRGDERLPVDIKIEIIKGEIPLDYVRLYQGSTQLAERAFGGVDTTIFIEAPEAFTLNSKLVYNKSVGDTWTESFEFTIFIYQTDGAENFRSFRITINYELVVEFELEPPITTTIITSDIDLPIVTPKHVPEWEPPMELMLVVGAALIVPAIIIIFLKNRR